MAAGTQPEARFQPCRHPVSQNSPLVDALAGVRNATPDALLTHQAAMLSDQLGARASVIAATRPDGSMEIAGLASTRRIIRKHGGEIHAEGATGKGVTFTYHVGAGW